MFNLLFLFINQHTYIHVKFIIVLRIFLKNNYFECNNSNQDIFSEGEFITFDIKFS